MLIIAFYFYKNAVLESNPSHCPDQTMNNVLEQPMGINLGVHALVVDPRILLDVILLKFKYNI